MLPHIEAIKSNEKYQLSQSNHLELIRKSVAMFANRTLLASVVIREPFVMYNEPSSSLPGEIAVTNIENYSGIAIEVVRHLRNIFNFKLKMVRTKDGQFGALTANNSWTGMMGALVKGEADIGVTALSITMARAQAIDFTRAYYVETAAILLRIPEEIQNYFAIFEPFSTQVWFLLLTTILILIFLITIMTKLEEKQREQHRLHKLAKFVAEHRNVETSRSRPSLHSEISYQRELGHKLAALNEAKYNQEFGSTWLERFYYATSCVLNILLIRG